MPEGEMMRPPGGICARAWKSIWSVILMAWRIGVITFLCNEIIKRPKKLNNLARRTDEVAVITGGTRGIGFEVVKKLLKLNFHVIIGARSVSDGEEAVNKIRENGIAIGSTTVLELDLKSLRSVRNFAKNVLQTTQRIDLLINNAGIMFGPFEETEDGYESQFQVNYLSHFLLTNLLLSKIKETSRERETCCRIVNVASDAHYGADIDFTDLEKCKVYGESKSYSDSKLCQILHAKYLDKKMLREESNVRVFSLHPGMIPSDLYVNTIPLLRSLIFAFVFLFKRKEEGADNIIYTAFSPELETEGGGLYINNSEIIELSHYQACDITVHKLLWDRSIQLTDLGYSYSAYSNSK